MNPIAYEFDVTGIDPYTKGAEALPAGSYPMAISGLEVKENNGKNGHNLAVEYTVTEGEFKGRKFYEALNLWHGGSPQAVEIAQKHLSSIGHAVGVTKGNDLTMLANKVMIVDLEFVEAKEGIVNPNTGEKERGTPARNNVLRRSPYTNQSAAQAQPHVPQNQPQSAPVNAAPAQSAPPMQAAQAPAPAPAPAPAAAPQTAPTQAAPAQAQQAAPPWAK